VRTYQPENYLKRQGCDGMSRILAVTPNDDYTLLIEFEEGNKILFNMQKLINTIPYVSLRDLERFQSVSIEGKALCWKDPQPTMMPLRITVDNILFKIRD
jgi:hypothetical protein